MKIKTGIVNYARLTAGHVTVTWNVVANAHYYKVYRTLVMPGGAGSDVTGAEQVGFVGQTWAPQFVDANIIPDFTHTPPIGNNPFAPRSIEHINVTNGGSGYTASATVAVAGGAGHRVCRLPDHQCGEGHRGAGRKRRRRVYGAR